MHHYLAVCLPYIDLIWIPLAALVVHSGQRIKAACFAGFCSIAMRLQIELIERYASDTGVFDVMHSDIHTRGVIGYSIAIACYLILCALSPGTRGAIFLGASISLYFISFTAMSVVLIL